MDPTPIPMPNRRGRKSGPTCRVEPEALKRAMIAANTTNELLSAAVGISYGTVLRMLTGKSTTARVIVEDVASFLGVEVSQLVIA